MKDCVHWMHWESLFHLNDEEIYRLLITLKNVNWVIAFTNENFVLFWREKFSESAIADCRTAELKWSIQQRYVLRINRRNDFGTNLDSLEYLLNFIRIFNLEGLQPWILKELLVSFKHVLFHSLFLQIRSNFLYRFKVGEVFIPSTNLFVFLLFHLSQQLNHRKNTHLRLIWKLLLIILFKRKYSQMLDDDRISLLSSHCFVSNSVQGSFYSENSHSCVVIIIHTYPSKSHCLNSLLKLCV